MSTAKGRATAFKFCQGDIRPRGQWPKYRGRRLKRRVATKGFASPVPIPPPPSWGPRRSPAKRVRWGEGGAKERNVVFGFSRKRNGADFAPTRGPGPQARRSLPTFHRWKVGRRRQDQKTTRRENRGRGKTPNKASTIHQPPLEYRRRSKRVSQSNPQRERQCNLCCIMCAH